jgi:hypothetical protein
MDDAFVGGSWSDVLAARVDRGNATRVLLAAETACLKQESLSSSAPTGPRSDHVYPASLLLTRAAREDVRIIFLVTSAPRRTVRFVPLSTPRKPHATSRSHDAAVAVQQIVLADVLLTGS